MVAFKWPFKNNPRVGHKEEAGEGNDVGKGKRQKAEIMNSSRVMTSKEEVVDLASTEQALRTKHGASWASEYFQGEDW